MTCVFVYAACRAGTDTIQYTVTDRDGRIGSGTVAITVTPGTPNSPCWLEARLEVFNLVV
jgi:hypothetical protein